MFCSKCGKTIGYQDQTCPNCGAPIGDNRFGGNEYTSAQFIIAPGQKEFKPLNQTDYDPMNNYTRTTYTGMDGAEQEKAAPDTRTTYRPVYEGASAPEEVRQGMKAVMEEKNAPEQPEEENDEEILEDRPVDFSALTPEAQEAIDSLDADEAPEEEIDMSQFTRRKIELKSRAGISQDVSDYIRKMENSSSRRGRHHRDDMYDDYNEDTYVEEGHAPSDRGDSADYENDGEYAEDEPRRSLPIGQIIKIVIALVLLVAIVFGGIKLFGSFNKGSKKQSPIEGVSKTLYESGIALIESHADGTYAAELTSIYNNEGAVAMSTRITQDNSQITSLLPEEPMVNDETFINALLSIQNSITNAVTMDVIYAGTTSSSESAQRWESINTQIASLKNVTTAAELTGVINAPGVALVTATPEPTAVPTVTYTSLQKGDKSNEVLEMQNRLYELGYLNDDRDGKFGSNTQTAVKAFQEAAGLTASGIADNETLTLLYSDDAPYAAGHETPAPTPSPTPAPEMIQPAEATGGEEAAAEGEDADTLDEDVNDV